LAPSGELWQRTENEFKKLPAASVNEVSHQIKITVSITFLDIQSIKGEPAA
jgi:hypothetical protein